MFFLFLFIDTFNTILIFYFSPLRLMMKALVEARKACRLPLLTGAAVVAYGFPVMADPAPLEEYFNSREININTESNNN